MTSETTTSKGRVTRIPVKEIMTDTVISIHMEQTLGEVIQIFHQNRFSGAPVVDNTGHCVGVLSKTDLVAPEFFEEYEARKDQPIKNWVIQRKVVSVPESAYVDDAADLMTHHHLHRIFVHRDPDHIVGVVSSYDILKVMAAYSDLFSIQQLLESEA